MKSDIPSSKIVVGIDGERKLASWSSIKNKITVQNIREEKEYLEHLGQIIQRDYFPDLAKAKGEYFPVFKNVLHTPGSINSCSTRNPEKTEDRVSLDKYIANNTTEDNASFTKIMEEQNSIHETKMSQFFAIRENTLALPSTDNLLALQGPKLMKTKKLSDKHKDEKQVLALVAPRSSLISHNSVHFIPDGASLTQEELADKIDKDRSIDSSNTRFKRPLPVADKKKILSLAQNKMIRYGPDGKEINPMDVLAKETPNVAGFRFVPASPSASEIAGGTDTPLITWGHLGMTPQRLGTPGYENDEEEGHYTPYATPTGVSSSNKTSFHMPSPSVREELAHKLADSAGKRRAQDREKQLNRVKAGFLTPSARQLLSSTGSSQKGITSPFLNFKNTPTRPTTGRSSTASSLSSLHYQSPLIGKASRKLGIIPKTPQRLLNSENVTDDLLKL